VQLTVYQEDEFIDRRLFDPRPWREPDDLDDLRQASEEGPRLAGEERRRHRPSAYRISRVIDFPTFMREAATVDAARRAEQRRRDLMVTDHDGQTRQTTFGELCPEEARLAWRGQRMFDDWTLSSAGRGSARICHHWVFKTSDYTHLNGDRWVTFVPAWAFGGRLAEIARAPKSAYELFGKLEAMDRRIGVPFGWYFFMLHGNRVHDWAGRLVLKAAEAGRIVLPEHDYRVLKHWHAQPYGF
jgi:hypothetical protein